MDQGIDFGQLLNIKEAALYTGRPQQTIRNYLGLKDPNNPEESRLPNAKKVKDGKKDVWQIPIGDLFEAGLMKQVKGEKLELSTPELLDTIAKKDSYILELETKIKNLERSLAKTKDLAQLEQAVKDLKKDIAHQKDLIEAKEQSLRDLRLFMGLSIETKETQEARRSGWISWISGSRKPRN